MTVVVSINCSAEKNGLLNLSLCSMHIAITRAIVKSR